jgi:CheY-like chemotaxis protein
MSSKRILVVEDEMIIALDMQLTLEQAGHDVEVATSAHEALEAVQGSQFDLAILDYHLKDDTVTPLAKELQGIGVPFIICSGSMGLEELEGIFSEVPYLAKPFTTDGLLSALDQAGRTDVH